MKSRIPSDSDSDSDIKFWRDEAQSITDFAVWALAQARTVDVCLAPITKCREDIVSELQQYGHDLHGPLQNRTPSISEGNAFHFCLLLAYGRTLDLAEKTARFVAERTATEGEQQRNAVVAAVACLSTLPGALAYLLRAECPVESVREQATHLLAAWSASRISLQRNRRLFGLLVESEPNRRAFESMLERLPDVVCLALESGGGWDALVCRMAHEVVQLTNDSSRNEISTAVGGRSLITAIVGSLERDLKAEVPEHDPAVCHGNASDASRDHRLDERSFSLREAAGRAVDEIDGQDAVGRLTERAARLLTGDQRTVFEHRIAGLTPGEIVTVTGKSDAAVRKTLQRIRERLEGDEGFKSLAEVMIA